MTTKAVVLLSGGLDSTTCAALATRIHLPGEVLGVSYAYGQKHRVELDAAARIAQALGIEHRIVQVPHDPFQGGTSTLIQGGPENPTGTYEELPSGISPTYVPFRNGTFLSLGAAIAQASGAEEIWFGAHAEDAARWAYPDCSPEFIGAMANAIYIGTYLQVRLVTPLEWLTKKEIVALGDSIGAPFDLTHSCYNGAIPACGKCPTCLSRLQAFRENGWSDPIPYA